MSVPVFLFGRFDDFDDAIDEAIEEDIRDLCDGEWTLRAKTQWMIMSGLYTSNVTPSMFKYSHNYCSSLVFIYNSLFHSQQPLTPNIYIHRSLFLYLCKDFLDMMYSP